jgi:hypothetical protein
MGRAKVSGNWCVKLESMGTLKHRTRSISFRITEEEFIELRQAAIADEAPSVSEFARRAVFRLIRETPEVISATTQMRKIDRRLSRLQQLLERKTQRSSEGAVTDRTQRSTEIPEA